MPRATLPPWWAIGLFVSLLTASLAFGTDRTGSGDQARIGTAALSPFLFDRTPAPTFLPTPPSPPPTPLPTRTPTMLPTPVRAGTAAAGLLSAASMRPTATMTLVSRRVSAGFLSPDAKWAFLIDPTGDYAVVNRPNPDTTAVEYPIFRLSIVESATGVERAIAPRATWVAWSPRGDWFVYSVPIALDRADYYVERPNGSGQRRVGTASVDAPPRFAGDSQVALASNGGLMLVDVTTGAMVGRIPGYNPTGLWQSWWFSPDGSLFVTAAPVVGHPPVTGATLPTYTAGQAASATAWPWTCAQIVGRDGSPKVRLATALGDCIDAFAWRPDSGALAFAPSGAGGLGLFVWDRASGTIREVFRSRLHIYSIAWSPDGRGIAFSAGEWGAFLQPPPWHLGLVNADGSEGGFPDWAPPGTIPWWSPDGQYFGLFYDSAGTHLETFRLRGP